MILISKTITSIFWIQSSAGTSNWNANFAKINESSEKFENSEIVSFAKI